MNNNYFSKIAAFVLLMLGLVYSNLSTAQYCTPVYTSVACGTTSEQDYFVSFATTGGSTNITNNEACPTVSPNYTYYTGNGYTVSAMQGSTITFTFVTTPSYAENVKIWVDWNQDGTFDPATEGAYNSAINFPNKIPVSSTVTDVITVPITATIGLTRMRARMVFSNQTFTDCSSETFGETEDYDFVVTPALPCVAPPVGGVAAINSTSVCNGTSVNLSLSGVSLGTGESYQWQQSANGINFTDIAGATGLTATAVVTGPTTYRCVVTCSGQSANSTTVSVSIANILGSIAVSSDSSVCVNEVVGLSLSNIPTGQTLSYQWQESTDGFTYNDIAGANAETFNYAVLDTTYVRCVATCGTQTSNSSVVLLVLNSPFACYCTANLNGSCANASISDFSINGTTLQNTANGCNSVPGVGAYTNFPNSGNTTTTISQLVNYTATFITSSAARVAVWIDYNHNGVFQASEWTQLAGGTLTPTVGGVAQTGTFTVPATSQLGLTKMRVRSRGSANVVGGINACTSFGNGETEDYFITIGAGVVCSAPPTPGAATASIDSVCVGQTFNLNLVGNSVGTGQTYQWQTSSDGSTWADVLGAVTTVLSNLTQPGTTYYRCGVTCSGQTAYSIVDTIFDKGCIYMSNNVVTTCNSTFSDSNPTGNYQNFESSTLTVLPNTSSSVVSATFNSFATENNFDGLMIYDGPDSSYPLVNGGAGSGLGAGANAGTCPVGSWRGTNGPGTVTATNSTGALTFVFTSEGSGNDVGWVADLSCVNVTPCAGAPTGGSTVANDSSVCENSTVNLSLTGNTSDFGITYQWQSSLDGLNFSDEFGATASGYNNAIISDTTYFRCKLKCGSDSSYSTVVEITFNNFYECYCGPAVVLNLGGTCGGNNIDSVSIANTTLNNNIGGCNTVTGFGAYTAYPVSGNTTGTLQQLVPYQLTVTNSGNSIQSLWIDFDHSGTFDDTEWTQISTTSTANTPTTISISVPVTSLTGLTGMRIRSRGNGNINGAFDACTQFFSGETEDYVINITSAQNCIAPPTAGTTVSSATSVCENSTITLSINGSSVGAGQTYQWQESTNGTTYTDVVGEVTETYLATIGTTAMYYQCNVTCSNQTASSTPVTVNVVSCYILTDAVDSVVTTCSGVFLDSGGDAANYSNSENGSYTFYPSSANSAIQVTFNSFGTEANYDGLMIYNGPDATYPLISSGTTTTNNATTNPLGAWNGTNNPGTVTSTDLSGALTFVWASEGFVTSSGWNATISCVSSSVCTGTPTSGNAIAADSSVCENSNVSLSLTGSSTGPGINYQWQESLDNITWTDIAGANNLTTTATISDTTYYRCKVKCVVSTDSTYSTSVMVTFNSFYDCYCGPSTSQNLGGTCGANNITAVSIATTTLNNAGTTCATVAGLGAYTAYSASGNTTATLQQLVPYQLSVTNNGNSIQSVWIDYDHSGTFDSNEWQQISATSVANTPNIVTLTVPATALTGLTGMRVRSRGFGNTNGSGDGCSQFFSGETEDYVINISAGQICVAPPTAGTIVSNATTVCAGVTVTMNLQGNSIGLGQTYQWQSSTNGLTFTNMQDDTLSTLIASQNQTTYYQCIVTCSGQFSTTTPLMLVTDCYTVAADSIVACSGTFYDSNPSGSYANNENYTSTIYPATAGNVVSVTFNNFATENNYDGLLIYNGPDATYPLIGSGSAVGFNAATCPADAYSGTNNPGTVTSTDPSGALTFVFASEGSGTPAGWDATISCIYIAPCSGTPTAGTIVPSTTITCGGSSFQLSLNGNSTGSGLSYTWQQAASASGPWTSIGVNSPSIQTTQSATSYYQCIVNCSGLSDTTAAYMITTDCYTVAQDSIVACSGTFYDSNSGGNYANNESFTSTIYPAIAGNVVSVTFNTFATENNWDGLLIYDGPDATYPLIASGSPVGFNATTCPADAYSGTNNPGTVTSTDASGALTFVFASEGGGTAAGWDATINCIYVPPCTAPPTPGTIISNSTSACGGINFQLSLTGNSIGSGLSYDWQTSNSPTGPWTSVGLSSATLSTSQSVSSYYQCIVTCSGVSATSTPFMMLTDCYTIAQDVITTCSGTFYDTNPSGGYSNNESYTSTIFPAVAGNMISVTFNSFATENSYDGLLIYDGPDATYPLIASGSAVGFNPVTCPPDAYSGTNNPGTVTSTDPSGALTFVFASEGSGTAAGWDATISCMSVAPCVTPIITAMGSTTVCQGGSVMLMSSVSTVSWTAVGSNNGSTSSSINADASGAYYVTNTSALCAGELPAVTNSNIITVTVNPAPAATTITADDNTLCTGGVATLTASPVISGAIYSWIGATGSGATATTANAGNVSVSVSQNGCSTTSNVIAVTVSGLPAAPTITSSNINGFICPQGTVNLTSSYNSGNSWSNNLGNLSTVTVNTAGTYTVTHTDANGCSSSASSAVINIPTPIVSVLQGSTTACVGNLNVLIGSNAPTGNVWSDNSTGTQLQVSQPGSYFTTIVVPGCTSPIQSNVINVTVNTPVPAVITASATAICGSANVSLSCNADPSYVSYVWASQSGSGIVGAGSTANVSAIGIYTVTITDNNGCNFTSASQTIGQGSAPTPVITPPTVSTVCEPGTVTLSTGSAQGAYVWLQNGFVNSALGTSDNIIVNTTGLYSVQVSNNGCSGVSSQIPVTINPLPNAAFISTPLSIDTCSGIVNFANQSTNASTFQWNFGDNSPQVNFFAPNHTYKASGVYNVTLVVQNACGSSTTTQQIAICSTIGVNDIEAEVDIAIFPNPVKDNITINYNNVNANTFKVEIMSIAGQVLYSESNNQFHGKFQKNIDMSLYAQGVYFVRIVTNKNTISRKIVKE